MLIVGDYVPDFTVSATSCKNVQLKALKGHQIVIYFYPKNNTPACIIENQDFAANYSRFRDQNTIVLGVSRDSLTSHECFKKSHVLPFELISDQDGNLCNLFGVLKEKQLFNKPITTVARSTFLINHNGLLIKAWRDVSIKAHVHDVIDYVEHYHSKITASLTTALTTAPITAPTTAPTTALQAGH